MRKASKTDPNSVFLKYLQGTSNDPMQPHKPSEVSC